MLGYRRIPASFLSQFQFVANDLNNFFRSYSVLLHFYRKLFSIPIPYPSLWRLSFSKKKKKKIQASKNGTLSARNVYDTLKRVQTNNRVRFPSSFRRSRRFLLVHPLQQRSKFPCVVLDLSFPTYFHISKRARSVFTYDCKVRTGRRHPCALPAIAEARSYRERVSLHSPPLSPLRSDKRTINGALKEFITVQKSPLPTPLGVFRRISSCTGDAGYLDKSTVICHVPTAP